MTAAPDDAPGQLVFERRSAMPVAAAELFAWHLRPGAFERLVPPGDGTRVVHRSGSIETNSMRVELSVPVLGPVRQRWMIRHEGYVPDACFADVMERGPFPAWRHEHRAIALDDTHSELHDHIVYDLPLGALGRFAGRPIVELKLAPMFTHRHAVTRDDLAAHAAAGLAPLRIELVDPHGSRAMTQLAAFLLTGGHEVSGDVDIVGHEQGEPPAADIRIVSAATGLDIERVGAASMHLELSGDAVADPRRVLAALAAQFA
ncbi:MAG: SRPBCC family protein [Thermoleophilia bacterium]|nr:SRPBCC family protein [Thermoleophilia bacterium]